MAEKYTPYDLALFVNEMCGWKPSKPDSDIYSELKVVGDDFHELIEKFAKTYSVDMSGYLWYFHADEEGQNFGSIFFKAPYEQVNRIPITPAKLAEFANSGKWNIQYPDHRTPGFRLDIFVNFLLLSAFVAWAIYHFWR
jgi:hypothetical protein